jgi:peroxiredoxin
MKHIGFLFLLTLLVFSCDEQKVQLKQGEWQAELKVSEDEVLPFNFDLKMNHKEAYELTIYNATEEIKVDEIELIRDSIIIRMPVFEGYIAGTFKEEVIEGQFIKESLERYVPFTATFGKSPRFVIKKPSAFNISGTWEVEFDFDTADAYPAKGIFKQVGDNVTGTFRTETGDYRFLEGVVDGNFLKLSTFDGSHAFLFTAHVSDSTLMGKFYSGNHYSENFKAKRNKTFELADENSLTYLKEGYDAFDFSFLDEKGAMVALSDAAFKNKVVLVQIMGTWCPNCLDETKFYVDYLNKHPNSNLQFMALAFEYANTQEKAWYGIQRLKKRVGVEYPVLLAQIGSSSKTKANEKLPMLNHVLSYPTTIYVDKKGTVRKIHTGFNGPATGEKYEEFKRDFEKTVQDLLTE